MATTSTRLTQHINAPRAKVYRALLDARAVARWMVPSGMTSHVHAFEGREGEAGWRSSLAKLAALTESARTSCDA